MQSIQITGGDQRQAALFNMLKQKGYEVYISGLEKLGIQDEEIQKPDCVMLPIPYKNEDGYIKAPFAAARYTLEDIVHKYPDSMYILGGCDSDAKRIFGDRIWYEDLLLNEAFLVRNALLTAQGAVCAYLEHSDTALCDTKCVVTGYGRIAKFLCRLLRAYGADVTATARKQKDLELIRAERIRAVHTKDLRLALKGARLIYNTIPFHVFEEAELAGIPKGAKLIELASQPYGMDMALAKKMGVDVQIEAGLPGRYFPASAAKAILHAFEREEQE